MIKIYSARPHIDKKDIRQVVDAVKNGWNDKRSFYLNKLSHNFSNFTKRKYALPLCNGTSAIHLALISLGIKKNDEVIVPDFTWTASASPITYVGAKPVFCDVDKKSLCLRIEDIKKCISKKTKAIIVVDLYGGSPDWHKIISLCKKKKIKIIEDAAESLGAYYDNKPIGSFGDISIFSFQATKLLSAGLGGILCTNNKSLYLKCLSYHHHGINKNSKKFYWSSEVGFNYQMTNMQAALVLSQLKKIKKLLNIKKKIFTNYKKYLHFKDIDFFTSDTEKVKHSHWINIIFLKKENKINKDQFLQYAKKYKIEFRPTFYTLSSMPAYKKYKKKINKNSEELSNYGICLPSGNDMTIKKIKVVSKVLQKIINENKSKKKNSDHW